MTSRELKIKKNILQKKKLLKIYLMCVQEKTSLYYQEIFEKSKSFFIDSEVFFG